MRSILLTVLALVIALPAHATPDPHSYAEPERVRVRSVHLDLTVDFTQKTLAGHAELALDWKDPKACTLALDTRDLTIARVRYADGDGWKRAPHTLGAKDPVLGQRLAVELPVQATKVRIDYRTSPQASGLQWLEPAQTMTRRHPFMFSQAQALHARSFVPLQDTPEVRFTYTASIRAPKGLRVVMSADNDAKATGEGGWRFEMPQPIPSYLLAIAVGELEFAPIGERAGVYAEPPRLAAATKELEDTGAMIDAAEKLFGPYRWGRYDLLILPPSFPFGGMENPRLTFATPTILAGDKSLLSLVAHELAHSWSGNLVTNASWAHLWLNEGFTTYVENRIVEAVFGAERAKMLEVVEQSELMRDLAELPEADEWLVPTLPATRDPDEVFSDVPYVKGAWLLSTLERRVGREAFDRFLRRWFEANAFRSVETRDFLSALGRELPKAMSRAELDAWLYQPGVPAHARRAESKAFAAVDDARTRFLAGEIDAVELPAKNWVTPQWLHFLDGMPASITASQLAELDAAFALTRTGNAEIALRWFRLGINAGYEAIRPALEKHLLGIGRRKLILPLWQALAARESDRAWAKALYARARPGYHPLAQGSVDAVFEPKP